MTGTMEKHINRVLEQYMNANLASEAAREQISKAIMVELMPFIVEEYVEPYLSPRHRIIPKVVR